MTLDIGCGKRKVEPDSIGIDQSSDSAADIVWDLNQFPWPIEDNRFHRIHMANVIEHVDNIMRTMAEVHRVAQDGASVFIATPHFSSHNSYVDPTHKWHLAAASFEYFGAVSFPGFSGPPFRFDVAKLEVTFGGNFLLDGLGKFLAKRNLKWYERHAAWIFPASEIRCELKVRK